jgi:Holliday junction resolvase RusA-like endonuclease
MYCDSCLAAPDQRPLRRTSRAVGRAGGHGRPEVAAAPPRGTERKPAPARAELWVPWACLVSDNQRRGIVGKAARTSHREYVAAKEYAVGELRRQWHFSAVAEPCEIALWLYPPDNRRRDGTNLLKGAMDSLVAAEVLADDSWQIARAVTVRAIEVSGETPGAKVYIDLIREAAA